MRDSFETGSTNTGPLTAALLQRLREQRRAGINWMVATKSGKKLAPAADTSMVGEEANLGLVSLELTTSSRATTWLTDVDDDEVSHALRLHQITIGKGAPKGEEQIVEAEFTVTGGKKSVAPLAFLSRGECNHIQVDIHFPPGTTFRLSEGQGPVYILGSHIVSPQPEEDVAESEDIEEEEDDDDEEENGDVLLNDGKHLDRAILEDNLNKKRKPDGECENGTDAKKFKPKDIGNSGSEEDAGTDDSPAME